MTKGTISQDFSIITANDKEYHVLLKRITGSRLYGTQYEKGEHPFDPEYVSDIDYRGIYVSPTQDRLSLITSVPEQIEVLDGNDSEFYDIQKFFKLAIDNNPNIMDILFGDQESEVFSNDIGKTILANKHLFISQKAKESFNGYATQQLYRMKQHHRWNKEYPEIYKVEELLTKAFNDKLIDFQWIADYFSGELAKVITGETANKHSHLEETITLEDFISKYNIDFNLAKFIKPNYIDYITVKNTAFEVVEKTEELKSLLKTQAGYSKLNDSIYLVYIDPQSRDLKGLFNREGTFRKNLKKISHLKADYIISVNHSDYKSKLKEIQAIWKWKVNRNEKRAVLEARFGYDVKHGMHLYRLLSSAKQLLLSGDYNPRLEGKDLEQARDILAGMYPYESLLQMANELQREIQMVISSGRSKLQKESNVVEINNLLMEIYSKF